MSSQPHPSGETIVRSLWLPVGRANFYSYTANGWLEPTDLKPTGDGRWIGKVRSNMGDDSAKLQVSVLRRLLEVLPRSFKYEEVADCVFSPRVGVATLGGDVTSLSRPVSVTLTLNVAGLALEEDSQAWQASHALRAANVPWVTLTVDEDGFYVLRAPAVGDRATIGKALDQHMHELLGGDFWLEWQFGPSAPALTGGAPTIVTLQRPPGQVYNGLRGVTPLPNESPTRFPDGEYYPLGVLNFFQLNTLFEGLFNDALTPAVFFEQTRLWSRYVKEQQQTAPAAPSAANATDVRKAGAATSIPYTVTDVVDQIMVDIDAGNDAGRVVTIRHFLAVTSRESLQRFKWSVESVRRGLLDEMMGILHRQSPLIQLKLDKAGEWTPELAYGANESQLRGYVMLAGAKLPLIWNVHRHASIVIQRLVPSEPGTALETADATDLRYRMHEWEGLLNALQDSVKGLETSVEHAWMERLLYEQEQSRAEQEAMAEIERLRTSRPSGGGVTGRPYNAVMLYVTILAAFAAVAAVQPSAWQWQWPPTPEQLDSLGPAIVITAGLIVFVLGLQLIRVLLSGRRRNNSVGYEFAFRLDQVVKTDTVQQHVSATGKARRELTRKDRQEMRRRYHTARHRQAGSRPVPTWLRGWWKNLRVRSWWEQRRLGPELPNDDSGKYLRASVYRNRRGLRLDRRGGARIEYASRDNTVTKVHLTVTFRLSGISGFFRRRARFEVINEFLARQVSEVPQYYLRETRIFGDSPRALKPVEIFSLLTFVLARAALVFEKRDDEENRRQRLTVETLLNRAGMIFLPTVDDDASGLWAELRGADGGARAPATTTMPSQRRGDDDAGDAPPTVDSEAPPTTDG